MILILLAFLFAPEVAWAKTFYVDAARTNVPACGKTLESACASHEYLVNQGCGGTGCRSLIAPGDRVRFAKGIYRERILINYSGSAEAPVVVTCAGNTGQCIIDGEQMRSEAYSAIVNIGPANFVLFRRFKIDHIPKQMYGIALVGSTTSHILINKNLIIGSPDTFGLIISAHKTIHSITVLKNQLKNCSSLSTGCTYFDQISRLAIVGNEFGPVLGSGNRDCNTIIGVDLTLVDGNTCRDSFDGFDQGMNPDAKPLSFAISRYNLVYGSLEARAFPVSGEGHGFLYPTGQNSIYKNVIQTVGGSCLQAYEGAQGILMAYNTCFNSGGYGSAVWIQASRDRLAENIWTKFSLFDSLVDSHLAPIIIDSSQTTIRSCPKDAPCPFVGNGFFMNERPSGNSLAELGNSSGGTGEVQTYTFNDFDEFNEVNGNSLNSREYQGFVDRTNPYVLENLRLVPGSNLIDRGEPFCRTTTADRGSAIPVTCQFPSLSPKAIFPFQSEFYKLRNTDCYGQGTRSAEESKIGCFDFQIEGCGIRKLIRIDQDSILKFQGLPCSWNENAAIHVPWKGTRPDVGALEY